MCDSIQSTGTTNVKHSESKNVVWFYYISILYYTVYNILRFVYDLRSHKN